MNSKPYYTLLIWDAEARKWETEFGCGYNESEVYAQGEALTEELSYYDSTWTLIVTDDDWDSIYAEIKKLNNSVEV